MADTITRDELSAILSDMPARTAESLADHLAGLAIGLRIDEPEVGYFAEPDVADALDSLAAFVRGAVA